MSYWCRNHALHIAGLALLAASGTASAQQSYWQPMIQVGAEGDTNRDLVTSGDRNPADIRQKKDAAGYNVDANAMLGYSTPTSDTLVKPEVVFSDYPSLHTNDLRTTLDLNSQIRSARGTTGILGQFNRESTVSSELASAEFNQVANLPTTPETGRVSSDNTRTLVTVVPSYSFVLTPRLNWGVTATLQDVDYTGNGSTNLIPYSYYLGGTSLTWVVDQRLDATFGVFGSRESGKDDTGSVKAEGVNLTFAYKWSTQFTGQLLVSVERDSSDLKSKITPATTTTTGTITPPSTGATAYLSDVRSTTTGAGATYLTTWKGQISQLQLSVGRTYTPSGGGGTYRADQLQVEYQRDLTQRLALVAAARLLNETAVSVVFKSSDYSYVTGNASLKWKMTPTWFITGGVEYLHEHFEPPTGSAANGMIFVAVGYQGLGKRT